MKIAYVVFETLDVESGVLKKIIDQIKAWEDYGHLVKLFIVSDSKEIWIGANKIRKEIVPPVLKSSLFGRLYGYNSLSRKINEWKPDIVYVRVPFRVSYIKKVVKRYATVFEVNSDELIEYIKFNLNNKKSRVHMIRYKWPRQMIFQKAKGIVFVTPELAKNHYSRNKIKSTIIPNGINLKNYPPIDNFNKDEPRIIFMGSPGMYWHGLEKVKTLALAFPAWYFEIIGPKNFGEGCEIPSNVHFHGHLGREEYEKIISQCDVAIGTLSLYENEMNEACPLKVREYMAYGLPVIIGYKDADFPEGAPFILQLPNTPLNIMENTKLIEKFVLNWVGKRIERKNITHIDISVKESKRLEFFNTILNSKVKHG
jgi:glycosyltransferase involved in cell wall biosynthesis